MKNNQPSILSHIGIEFETEDVTSRILSKSQSLGNTWRTTHDASIESDRVVLSSGIIIKNTIPKFLRNRQKEMYGTELVSIPFDCETVDLLRQLKELTQLLSENGESCESYRAGIHIHVSMPENLDLNKAMLKLGSSMEDIFFYIGGQGYAFRGTLVNDNAYCRPITRYGPPCVPIRGGFAQVFTLSSLLDSESNREFWHRYGELNVGDGGARYVPQRYTWLNLYSLLAHGTLEFRVFNKTLNPLYINAEVELCRKFCKYVVYNLKEINNRQFPEHSIYDEDSRYNVLDRFYEYAGLLSLSESTTRTLAMIIKRTPEIRFEHSYIHTHLAMGKRYWEGSMTFSPQLITDKIKKPDVIDIHRLRGERF